MTTNPNNTAAKHTPELTPVSVLELAELLVARHNDCDRKPSLYGAEMDKALCRDLFATLFVYPDGGVYDKLVLKSPDLQF